MSATAFSASQTSFVEAGFESAAKFPFIHESESSSVLPLHLDLIRFFDTP